MAMTAKLWSINAAATELGKDRRTVAKALDGVPADGRIGVRPAWLLSTIIAAMNAGASAPPGQLDPAHERARKDRALADRTEMENDVRRGELVAIADVIRLVGDDYGRVRSRILSIPSRCAPRIAAERDPAKVAAMLQDEINLALRELSAEENWG
jgi:hypothetical protein